MQSQTCDLAIFRFVRVLRNHVLERRQDVLRQAAPAVGLVTLVPTHLAFLWPHSVRYIPTSVSSVAYSGRRSSEYVDFDDFDELQPLTFIDDSASHTLNEPCLRQISN
jgi:hypothetical protein